MGYRIILRRHRSLGHESSFARQLSHEIFAILAKPLLSPPHTEAEARNSLSYKYTAIWKALGQGLPCSVRAKNIAWPFFLPFPLLLPWDLAAQSPVEEVVCFVSFPVTFTNVMVLETIYFSSPFPTGPTIWLIARKVGLMMGLNFSLCYWPFPAFAL